MLDDTLERTPDALDELDPEGSNNSDELVDMPLAWITCDPDQDRKDFDSESYKQYYEENKSSIAKVGVRDAIKVFPIGKRNYRIIEGENRYRISSDLGLETIPTIIRKGITFDQALTDQLIENLNRRNLSPYEEALAFKRRRDNGMSEAEFIETFGKKAPWISKRKSLLKAPEDVLEIARSGKIRNIDTLNTLAKKPDEERVVFIQLVEEGRFQAKMLDEGVVLDGISLPAKPAKSKKSGSTKKKNITLKPYQAAHILSVIGDDKLIGHEDDELYERFNEFLNEIEEPS